MDAITINSLTKIFTGKRRSKILALDRLDLIVPQGEVFGFLGPNGAGKSTTIKIMMGLIRASRGDCSLLGVPVDLAKSRRQVGYLPENPSFYDYLHAREYLGLVGDLCGMPRNEISIRSEELLHRFDLWEARKRPIRSYSKGMVQRLGLAQVMLHAPSLYILDEPMSGLDPLGRALVKDVIKELRATGKTVFFSTHITSDVEAVCDRVGIIFKGRLQRVAEVDTLMTGGIVGYKVRHRHIDADRPIETDIGKDALPAFLAELEHRGEEILLVNPVRRNIEDFFLEIVRNQEGEEQPSS